MKMLKCLSILGTGILLASVSGCYYSYPRNTPPPANATTMAIGAAGAAAGAYAGNQMDSQIGAPLGAVAGGLAAGGLAYTYQSRKQRELAEAYEEGLRRGRAQVFEEWWDEYAIEYQHNTNQTRKARTRQVPLPSGYYESVPHHPRSYEYRVAP